MNAIRIALCVVLLTGCALAQSDNNLNLDSVKQQIPGLNIDEASLPNKEEVEKVLKEKCEKNGGAGTYEDILASKDKVQECLTSHLNQTQIMEELEEAKKDGSMDDIFGKYCKKREEILSCVTDVTNKVEKCLEPVEKDNMKLVLNITQNLIDFVCFKDGDRLAMFVAEGGFECLQSHKEALQDCANNTIAQRIPKDLSITNLPLLTFKGETQCADMAELQECAVVVLEKCENNTPANIVEALFKFIKKVSPCKDWKRGEPMPQRKLESSNSSPTIYASFYALVFTLVVSLHLM